MAHLSDLLRAVRLDGASFYPVEASAPWELHLAALADPSRPARRRGGHLIPFHFLAEGRCFGGMVEGTPSEMAVGDLMLFPRGDAHVLTDAPEPVRGKKRCRPATGQHLELGRIGEGSQRTALLICGFLEWDRDPFHPLLRALPRQMHMREMAHGGCLQLACKLADESRRGRAGAEGLLTHFMEFMLMVVLRRHVRDLPPEQAAWLAGSRDPSVGRALALIHANPDRPWTLAGLAREATSSRSSLCRRFTERVGRPPMQYLAQWRMRVAADLLRQSGEKVATIAGKVGYSSEAAFSRVFKKTTGYSPGAWRDSREILL